MSLIGKNTLSYRKKDVLEQKESGTAYERLIFAHKAGAGETGINLTALVQPSEMAALGFVNPNISDLLAAKMLFHKKNLTVVSSVQGILIQDLQYTVPTNQRIAFQGFTSSLDEIFTCIIESSVKDGLNVVDSTPIISTGMLAAGQTQYNVGVPFQVGKYINHQVGAVMVFLDGVQQFRNSNNSSVNLDGNYYEIAAGSGLGSIVQFNAVDDINDRSVLIIGENAAERPTGSMMAVIETIAGQMDQVIPTVAALAGVPETNFQAAPNNVDLKNFGDRVVALEQMLDLSLTLEVEPRKVAYIRHEEANGVNAGGQTSGSYVARKINVLIDPNSIVTSLSSNQITLPAGNYEITCEANGGVATENIAIRLQNVTDAATLIQGIGNENGAGIGSDAYFDGSFTLVNTKVLEIQFRVSVTNATTGWGEANAFGDTEVYLIAKLVKPAVYETKTLRDWLGL